FVRELRQQHALARPGVHGGFPAPPSEHAAVRQRLRLHRRSRRRCEPGEQPGGSAVGRQVCRARDADSTETVHVARDLPEDHLGQRSLAPEHCGVAGSRWRDIMRTGSSVIRASAGAVAFMACLTHVVESRQTPAGRMRAGAAKVEITPKPSDLTIATDSIRDPLFARVVVVDDGSGVGPAAAQFPTPQVFAGAPAAPWIFSSGAGGNEFGVFHFRRVFELNAKPASFVVHVSADNRYRLFVNGEQVSSGPQRSDLMHWRYETVDLAPQLRAGRN